MIHVYIQPIATIGIIDLQYTTIDVHDKHTNHCTYICSKHSQERKQRFVTTCLLLLQFLLFQSLQII